MSDDVVTFAEILKRQGYSTGYAGKWHLDGNGKPQFEPKRKFGFDDNRYMFNRGHWKQLEDAAGGPRVKGSNGKGGASYSVKGADEKSFTTDFLADRTVEFIRANKDRNFCYMVSFPDPHGPDTVRAPYDDMYSKQQYVKPRTCDVTADKAPKWGEPAEKFQDMAHYYGMVKCIDDNVGKILNALRKDGLVEKTIIVFTSDHGDLRGEHGRQNKGVPFEASAKIPFMIHAPSVIKPGTVVREALGCVDFLPTIINLMGFKTAGREEGRDASSLLVAGKAPDGWKDIAFFRSTGEQGNWLAAVGSGYKIVYSPIDNPWLFDLKKDPDELTNFFLDQSCREVVRNMSAALLEYGRRFKDPDIDDSKIKADLAWAVSGTGPFHPAPIESSGKKGKKKKKGSADEE
jgi:arylsulfatase A-like enzyme